MGQNCVKIYWNTAQIQRTSALFPTATNALGKDKGLIEYILKKALFFSLRGWKVKQDHNLDCKKTKSLQLFHIYIWAWREESSSIKKALEGQSWKSQCMWLPCAVKSCVSLQQIKSKPKYFYSIAVIRSKQNFFRYVSETKEC